MSVGPCFGFCPVYDIKIAPDGEIIYNGDRHTAELGLRARKASVQTYLSLVADLAPYRPAAGKMVEIECAAAVSDTPLYTISWIDPKEGASMATHRSGCQSGPGHELDAVLRQLPARLGITHWSKQTTRPGASRG
ncbi:DUF6438 domain-containing protein [Sphingomonas natans]|uniref:DUF6438 domain-containing protein n=1 Tax=Sphingomonas natans TaxID=3063330 RepID=UPI003D66A8E4